MGPNTTNYEASLLLNQVVQLSVDELESLSSSEWVKLVQDAVIEAEKKPQPFPRPAVRWEYKVERKPAGVIDEAFLNVHGFDGWEVCGKAALNHGLGMMWYFKRELQ